MGKIFQKLNSLSPLSRDLLIVASLLFLVGAAVNDGLTGWFWGLPFLYVLYVVLPLQRWIKIFLCSFLLAITIFTSNSIWDSRIIFPVIGQKVVLVADVPTQIFPADFTDDLKTYYDTHPEFECSSWCTKGSIKRGTIFEVKRIEQRTFDLGAALNFVLSDGTNELIINDDDFDDLSVTGEKNQKSFCHFVEWEFCNSSGSKEYRADPMRTEFRWLASLMYYPVAPFLMVIAIPTIINTTAVFIANIIDLFTH